ncbi:MAG: hypothetical protein GY761_10680 [Hyphomicrobiales bacterium]|nr:hypothetical protein [Hyphomicrobiales bacterium]
MELGPMPTECRTDKLEFKGLNGRRVVASFDGGAMTSDAGILLLGEVDRAVGLFSRVAACFSDHRSPALRVHEVRTLVAQRIAGIALGYEDINDHDDLRHDQALCLLSQRLEAGRSDCALLAGKSTLNRLEHAPDGPGQRYHKIVHDGAALERLFVDLYLDAHPCPPKRIILDLDAIWPPLALIAMAAAIGLVNAAFGIKSLAILAIIGIAILVGDCFGRSKDYLSARRRFVEARGHDERTEVIRRFGRAWCARIACSADWKREYAGIEVSERFVDDVYFTMGHRWWHYFPDGTFTKNSPFLKLAFWIHLFTGKMKRDQVEQHKPRIDLTE